LFFLVQFAFWEEKCLNFECASMAVGPHVQYLAYFILFSIKFGDFWEDFSVLCGLVSWLIDVVVLY